MKKRLLAGAMACILMLGATAFAEVDLSGMNNAELQQLYTNVLSALSASENTASFSVDGGFILPASISLLENTALRL